MPTGAVWAVVIFYSEGCYHSVLFFPLWEKLWLRRSFLAPGPARVYALGGSGTSVLYVGDYGRQMEPGSEAQACMEGLWLQSSGCQYF